LPLTSAIIVPSGDQRSECGVISITASRLGAPPATARANTSNRPGRTRSPCRRVTRPGNRTNVADPSGATSRPLAGAVGVHVVDARAREHRDVSGHQATHRGQRWKPGTAAPSSVAFVAIEDSPRRAAIAVPVPADERHALRIRRELGVQRELGIDRDPLRIFSDEHAGGALARATNRGDHVGGTATTTAGGERDAMAARPSVVAR
jgi:hypothetical protein